MTVPGDEQHRLYTDVATWWPLISPPQEYAGDADIVRSMLATAARPVREVLELGSGGGHLASHLTGDLTLTLVDAAPAMLEVSRRLNPDCDHVLGDMRTVRLDRTFDAVLVHDAIDYMRTEAELTATFATTRVHCRPGGVVVLMPDDLADTFHERTEHGGSDGPDGRGARYLEWTWDPDPDDHSVRTEYAFLLRAHDGTVTVVLDRHDTGLFARATWLRLLGEAGFDPVMTVDEDEDWGRRTNFLAHCPTRGS